MLGACPNGDFGEPVWQGNRAFLGGRKRRVHELPAQHIAFQEIHRRRPYETGNKAVVWIAVEIKRRAHLLNTAIAQHHNFVCHGHCFDLIVGHIDHGGANFLVQAGDFYAHVDAQFGVEVGQWFVKQEDFGATDNGSANSHTLPLTTGERFRFALEVLVKLQNRRGFLHLFFNFCFGVTVHAQAKTHVLRHRHMRVERVGLEHHRHATFGRVHMGHVPLANVDLAVGGLFKARNHAQ
mmetsp:Transcript_4591/g.7241  ORF Transcript_4591/g.7241 Transcript_4591/m.7241 type:complete len:237 (-) Transcript_4591:163-873(-)